MNPATYHARRRFFALLQVVLMLGLPFVRISGESALRFDVPSLKLYFFGSVIWISEAYFFLLVFLIFFLGIMLFTVIYGHVWCGWMCPQTVLSDVARAIEKAAAWLIRHRVLRMVASRLLLIALSALVSANLIWFVVSPYEFIHAAVTGTLGPWTFRSWVVLSALIYLNLGFVRQKFCSSVCPYTRCQSALFDDRTLLIDFDRTRQDACSGYETMRRGKTSLPGSIQETDPEALPKGMRRRVAWLSAFFALIAAVFVYQVFVRMPMDFWVMRDDSQEYHQVGVQGALMNAYSVVVENRGLQRASYRLSVSGVKDAKLVLVQNPFVLPGNSLATLKVYVIAQRKNLKERVTRLHFILENTESTEMRIVQEAPFVYPERSEKGVEI
jgi:polyferredoxin